jgi:tRNA-dihydrouridine synthase
MSPHPNAWRFCVAPMMEWTDRHFRMLARQHTRHARLYTEMVTGAAVRFGDRERLLGFDPHEAPLAVQLGGCDPAELAEAAPRRRKSAPTSAMTKSTSMSDVPPTGCRTARSARR